MSRVHAVLLPLVFLVAVASTTPAAGDPIRVVAGVVDTAFGPVGGPWDGEDLQLTAAGFHIGNALEDAVAFVQLTSVPAVTPGASVNLSGVLRVQDALGARLNRLNGIIAAPFNLSFDTPSARLACTTSAMLTECATTAPFRFAAEFTFTPFEGAPSTQRLVGRGTAEGRLFRSGLTESGAVRYTFDASPVPEPGTFVLFTSGLLLVGLRTLRKYRNGCAPV
jgi:PEP-CTERM motif